MRRVFARPTEGCRETFYTTKNEMDAMLMLDQKLRLPGQLQHQPLQKKFSLCHELVINIKDMIEKAY